ncbi:GFA family protein [Haloferula sargassicola]|uniref:CENP-V/GFA domain-containing protein n=1 Tax=Haloferula sargassicola TaxID=490096 RepID=A0ABP9UPR2_9BACT
MTEALHTGGCLCGRVRYQVRGSALQTSLCHCEDCRRASGAPFVAWTFFPPGALAWTTGEPRKVEFAGRERWFCGDCGSPLLFVDPAGPDFTEVNTCTLDRADAFPPGDQCWVHDELRWTSEIATLPRFDETSPLPGDG